MDGTFNVTLDDVAREAGVSPKTVSRVLNHEPNVRTATREKVLKVASDLGYRPNPAARSLAGARSYLIGHLYDNPDQDYIARANAGMYKACREGHYLLLPEPLENREAGYADRVIAFLNTSRVDGILLTPPLSDDKALIKLIRSRNVPVIVISAEAPDENISAVSMDDYTAARVMTEHLIGLGHTRIGFVSGPPDHGAAAARRLGFADTIRRAGLSLEMCPMAQGDFSLRSGLIAAEEMLAAAARPTAIFAANDAMAAGAMTAVFKAGLSIPDDISISGFHASQIGAIVWPALTTIRQPIGAMSEQAATWLISGEASRAEAPLRQSFPFELVVRGSTAAV